MESRPGSNSGYYNELNDNPPFQPIRRTLYAVSKYCYATH